MFYLFFFRLYYFSWYGVVASALSVSAAGVFSSSVLLLISIVDWSIMMNIMVNYNLIVAI